MNELLERARVEMQPAWDELREARVLARVQEARLPAASDWTASFKLALGAAALAAAGVGVVWKLQSGVTGATEATGAIAVPMATASRSESALAVPSNAAAAEPAKPSLWALADGSNAYLSAGAEVVAVEQSRQVVRLEQRLGSVRYEVRPDSDRRFTVLSHGVEVRVVGTAFSVAVEAGAVQVSVERGRVAVTNGAREVDLAAGESLRVARVEGTPTAPPTAIFPSPPALSVENREGALRPAEAVAGLLEQADAARARGDQASAERAFATIVAQYPQDARAQSAAFSMGRLQRARGNFAGAAGTFKALRQKVPNGPLAEDASAEEANAWALAGQLTLSRSAAEQYIKRYPQGAHASRMQRLLQK